MKHTRATRISTSLTARWEKKNLPRLAAALPGWATPDHLTGLALVAAVAIATCFTLSNLSPWWMLGAVVGLALHWLGDSLDGTLARVRRIERERYGYFVDHIADAAATVIVMVGFGLSPHVQLTTALMLAISYLLLQIRAEIEAYTSRKFRLSYAWIGPTEARILLAAVCIALTFWTPPIVVAELTIADLVCLAIAGVFLATFVVCSTAEARSLAALDRPETGRATIGVRPRYSRHGRHRPSGRDPRCVRPGGGP